MPIEVRSAKKTDLRVLSRILGQAFHEDPLMRWVRPDVKARTRALPTLFAALTRYHYLPGGGVEMAEREHHIGAAALWAPPGRWRNSHRDATDDAAHMLGSQRPPFDFPGGSRSD